MRLIIIILFVLLYNIDANAQQVFSEGTIVYDVAIDPPANQEGIVQYKGTYTITAKGQQIKEELMLENGYTSTLLFNYREHTAYSLKTIGGKQLAIELDMEQLQNGRKKYEGFVLKNVPGTKDIAGMTVQQGIITYANGNTAEIYYSKDWLPGDIVFDNYPGIQYLLFSFTNHHEDGIAIHFTAKKITQTPVNNSVFRIPIHYKIMSKEEYRQLSGK